MTIPFGFRKSEEEGRIRNFERAAHLRSDAYEGKMPFDDTDVYKLIEGASYSLQSHPDPELDRFLDAIIAKIAAAQEPDGYLTTYKTIDPSKSPAEWLKPGPKWQLELQGSHELYNSGHLYEAAYAHYRATGKRTLLDVARKNADLVARTFGPGKLTTPPGAARPPGRHDRAAHRRTRSRREAETPHRHSLLRVVESRARRDGGLASAKGPFASRARRAAAALKAALRRHAPVKACD